MLKNISNVGSVLSKDEQKSINGGFGCTPYSCWYFYGGGPWFTPDDFSCDGNVCVIHAI